MFDRTTLAGHLINWAARLCARTIERRLKTVGMLPSQLPIFLSLLNEQALTQKRLAKLAAIEQPSMAVNLSRMERDGLISRSPDPNDGRSSLISLTPRALEIASTVKKMLQEGNSLVLAGFKDDEKSLFIDMLRRVIDNLEGAGADEAPRRRSPRR